MAGAETRRVRALAAKTEFVPGHGMVVMDPDSAREELNFPRVPVEAIGNLVAKGLVADDVTEAADAEPAPKRGGGRKGTRSADAEPADEEAAPIEETAP